MPVLAPGQGRTKTGRLWAYVRDDRPAAGPDPPAVVYRYSPDRKGERPQAHMASFAGILQADGYSGFTPLYANGRVLEAACWAHARRKYCDVLVPRDPTAPRNDPSRETFRFSCTLCGSWIHNHDALVIIGSVRSNWLRSHNTPKEDYPSAGST